MTAYPDVKQCKKLAEILPIESADMCWCNNSMKGINYTDKFSANLYTVKEMKDAFDAALNGWDKYWELIPCWSLSALLDVLPYPTLAQHANGLWSLTAWVETVKPYSVDGYDNKIDACYNMIVTLNNMKLL